MRREQIQMRREFRKEPRKELQKGGENGEGDEKVGRDIIDRS